MTDPAQTEPYYRLGTYHRPTDTPSPQAQLWFDRGMVWSYAFNHEEAIRCFERALALDPDFAFARWGIAYAVGPNYNKAWDAFDPADRSTSLCRARADLERASAAR
ncbi:tetratricopeptide repeat protein, partial [Streptomyces sp. DSM 41534]